MPKILVVDDNEQLSSMLKDVLESWGYTALTATEGRSCLEIARQEQPDIILLDIMLPGLSGYEVCSELKRDGRTHSIAVIMMTALEDMESRIHGYKVGADNFLVKPINYNEVKAIIQKLLKEKLYEDTLEESCNVAKAFRKFGQLLLGRSGAAEPFLRLGEDRKRRNQGRKGSVRGRVLLEYPGIEDAGQAPEIQGRRKVGV